MRSLLPAIFSLCFIAAQAQNTLLESTFWQKMPDVSAVKAEVEKGNNPAEFNRSSFDPVVLAINAGAPLATIQYLIGQPGNSVAKVTHDGRNYIHWAASRGNVELMEYLVSKGSKANVEDSHGYTPLNFAANGGQQNTKVYDICIAAGADLKKDLSPDGANALLLAVANDKDFKLTNYFVSKGLDIKSQDAAGNNAFGYAARTGNLDLLKALMEKGVPVSDNAMLMAAQGSRRGANPLPIYQYLETLKVKPITVAKNGENALHIIVRRPGQLDIIQYFLSKGVDVNQQDAEGNTVFMNAASGNRDTTVMAALIPHVKDINTANAKGVTALAMAVRGNSPEMVRYLLNKGASVMMSDINGDNLGYYLVQSYVDGSSRPGPNGFANGSQSGDFDVKLKLIQAKGFQPASPQKNGSTLYHLAVAKNNLALLKHLEPLKIDVNAKNKEGYTALHKAAMISKDDVMMKYLLSIGASKDIVTSFDESAFSLASENEALAKNNVSIQFLK